MSVAALSLEYAPSLAMCALAHQQYANGWCQFVLVRYLLPLLLAIGLELSDLCRLSDCLGLLRRVSIHISRRCVQSRDHCDMYSVLVLLTSALVRLLELPWEFSNSYF